MPRTVSVEDITKEHIIFNNGLHDKTFTNLFDKESISGLPRGFVKICYSISRPLIDFAVSSFICLGSLPVIALFVIIIKLTSKGPAFFLQDMVGLNGRVFKIIRLRTMHMDSQDESDVVGKTRNDDRVTTIGRFLRKTQMDELPQLFNVMKGDMSFIGPRPERPVFAEKFAIEIPGYSKRLTVKPGITGLAQCYYKYDQSTSDVCRKLRFDIYYINRKGWQMDLKITLLTIFKILFSVNGYMVKTDKSLT